MAEHCKKYQICMQDKLHAGQYSNFPFMVAFVVLLSHWLMHLQWYLPSQDEFCCVTHNALTTLLSCLSVRPPCGIKAEFCHALLLCRLQGVCLARLWRLSSRTTLIATIVISNDVVITCCCLSWLTLPSPDAPVAFAARFILVIY